MAAPTTNASVTTNPGGTGATITPTLPTHAAGDIIEIFVVNSGVTTWSAPAGWTIKRQQASSGNASTGVIGTLLYRRVLTGDTLPLASPTCTLGATVTRSAVALTKRGADLESVHVAQEWLAFASNAGTSNPIRPTTVTTLAPEMLVHIYYGSRSATNAPEQTNYTQVQEVVISGTIANNVSQRTISDQNTTLSNQDASPTSGARWIAIISCTPSPDYPYYRSGSQAFNANATSVTPALPTGTTASDNRGNKDLVVLTAQCAGVAPTVNTPGHWTLIDEWSNTTSGGVTTVRKWRAVYTGTLDRQVNRTPSGEIFAYLSVYHNVHQTIPVGTSAVQQNASSTTSTFPALSRTGTHATVQATCVADATPTFTPPSGWTERNDSQGVTCADQSFNTTGTTASASFTLNSASPTLCGLMEVFSVASVINLILTPASASLTLTGFAPSIDIDVVVTPDAASLTLATFAPSLPAPVDFPFTNTLDDFNRANENPIANGTWGGQLFVGDANIELLSNQARGTGASTGGNHGWLTQYGPDCEVYLEIVSISGEDSVQVFARLSAIGGSFTGYSVRARAGATNNLLVLRWDAGSPTIIATLPQTVSDGDCFGLRLVDDLIEVYYKDVSISSDWFLLGDVTDASYADAGYLGLYTFNNVNVIDNFGGGTVGVAALTPATVTLTLSTFAPQLREVITPTSSSLSLTTFAPSVTIKVTVLSTSLSLTTFAPAVEVTANITVTPATASLTLTSFAVQLREVVTPASQSLALTTFAVRLAESITPATASLLLATFAPAVTTNTILTPASGALTLTTTAPQLREVVTPSTASLSLVSFAPTVTATANVTVTPAAVTLTATGFAPELREQITPDTATLTLTTFAPEITVSADVVVTPAAQVLVLIGLAPSLLLVITPSTSSLSLSTLAPTITISADRTETPIPALLTLTSFTPELQLVITPTTATLGLSTSAPSLVLVVQPDSTTLALTTFAPVVTVGGDMTITPAPIVLALTAFAPTVTTGALVTTITPAPVILTLTAYAPFVVAAGPTPPSRIFVVQSARRTFTTQRPNRTYLVPVPDREEVLV